MEIAKALILAGSANSDRPWPVMPGSRHLFPVGNRPILFHNLEALGAAGILEATILAEPGSATAIAEAVGDGREWGLTVHHAEWRSPGGLNAALAAGREFVGDEPVLVEQADALLRERMHGHITTFADERLDALALRLERPVVPLDGQLTPGYLLSPRAVSILTAAQADRTSPVSRVRAYGGRVRVQPVDGCLPCHGDVEGLLDSNRRVLEGLVPWVDESSLEHTTVHGPVRVHPSARVRGSLLRGPLIVGPRATITDAYVGPYTSIGAGVAIEAAEIEHSIVLADAQLRFIGTRLESSVIGQGARIVRGFSLPSAMRLTVGENAEILLS